jgi:3-deoxy-D-manno-octulosonic-acid transferase
MILRAYNVILTLSLPVLLPYFLMGHRRGRRLRRGFGERLRGPGEKAGAEKDHPVWFHAASVGEVQMTLPLVQAFQRRFSEYRFVLSTMTETGQDTAKRLVGERGTTFFLPLDFPWTVRKVLDAVAPRALFIAETEIWPNLVHQCEGRAIPVVLFNGRISDRSFGTYRRFRFFFKEILRGIAAFGMQSERDAERIIEIGAAPERVSVTGNLKFDRPIRCPAEAERRMVRNSLGLRDEQPVFVAGSTHPGEEEIVLRAFGQLKEIEPSIVLILAPRHLERLDEVTRMLDQGQFGWVRKSQMLSGGFSGDVILLDTMGELERTYSVGSVIFVGGSLVPVGGHNILEPAAWGKPVAFGPHMENFREIASVMKDEGGGIEVQGHTDLFGAAQRFLTDRSYFDQASRAALRAIENNQGAVEKTLQILETYLEREPLHSK